MDKEMETWRGGPSLQAVNVVVVCELVKGIQIPPPQRQEPLGDEAKPGRDGDVLISQPAQERTKVLSLYIMDVLHLVLIGTERHIFLEEQYVVQLMFTPSTIGRAGIVDPCEVREVARSRLLRWNA